MDLRQLEMFLAVVEERGFNKAAAKLYVSQSAISRKVGLLEGELGQKLLTRVGNRTVPTPAGRILEHQAHLIFRQIHIARMEVSGKGAEQRGEIVIGAAMSESVYLLPQVVKKFQKAFPKIELKVLFPKFDEVIQWLRSGRLDVGIVTLPVTAGHLEVAKLFTEELVVVVSTTHPWRGLKDIRAAELRDRPIILVASDTNTRRQLDAAFRQLGIVPNITAELPNFAAIKPLVEMNLGISILSRPSITLELRQRRLHALRLKEMRLQRDIGLVYLKSSHLPRALAKLIQIFHQHHGQEEDA
jgi:DNA-binding transcriptional LysR family regulator